MRMSPLGRGCGSNSGHNMETLKMSRKERDRLTIMAGVKPPGTDPGASRGDAGLELPADQAGRATLSGRRATRDWCLGCGASPVHGASCRRCGRKCWGRYEDERHADFGPTLMAEHRAQAGLVVDRETLRRWLLATGKWTVRRRRQKHRQTDQRTTTKKKGDILS